MLGLHTRKTHLYSGDTYLNSINVLDDFAFLGQIELKTIFSYTALQQCFLDCKLV